MIEDIEAALTDLESRIISWLTWLQSPVWPFIFSLLVPIVVSLTLPFWTQFDYLKIAHWDVVKNVEILFIFLVLLSPLSTVIHRRHKTKFYFLVVFVSWFVHCHFKDRVFTPDPFTWLAGFAVPVLLSVTWFISFKRNWPARVGAPALIVFAFLCAIFVGFVADKSQNTVYIDIFWGAHVEIFLLVALVRLLTKNNLNQTDLDLTINPMNLIIGVFWPLDLKDHADSVCITNRNLWWRGYYAAMTGVLLQLVSMIMFTGRASVFSYSSFLGFQWVIICGLLGLTALARMAAGVARIYGVNVPDCSNFVLFSRSPVDTLRRGYVYAYEFNLRYICLPLFRRTRSIYFAVLFTFLFYVFYRFLVQPFLIPKSYNLVFSGLSLYIAENEVWRDLIKSLLLLSMFFIEPAFIKLKFLSGKRYGDLCCILLTYLVIGGMNVAEPELIKIFRALRAMI